MVFNKQLQKTALLYKFEDFPLCKHKLSKQTDHENFKPSVLATEVYRTFPSQFRNPKMAKTQKIRIKKIQTTYKHKVTKKTLKKKTDIFVRF